ncbi:MAG TPA: sulfite exporter TauE/SafE family protein [Streptosporangiaceae bacterium]|nr:sulfite exporter TauE/SafE family protein [Streptosporangiaceae bacterium]
MTVNPYIVLGSAVVGLLVGLTGAGGGALMTPMLILLFGVKPSAAISSDLVAAVLMRPVGAAVHLRKGTVNLRLVGWMVLGSVPAAFLGAYLLHVLGGSSAQQKHVEVALGAALLVGAAAMVLRYILDRRSGTVRTGTVHKITVRPLPTVLIGVIGGVIVGMTSVGSGSLMIVLLLFLYPLLSAGQLVGTDLTQAVPLTAAAAVGALIFGTVQFGVTASIVIGSVPAVLIGSFLSSRAPDRYIRPIITFVIFASGLKYIGVGTTALGWILCVVALGGGAYWLARVQPWRNGRQPALDTGAAASAPSGHGRNGDTPAAGTWAQASPGDPDRRPRAG